MASRQVGKTSIGLHAAGRGFAHQEPLLECKSHAACTALFITKHTRKPCRTPTGYLCILLCGSLDIGPVNSHGRRAPMPGSIGAAAPITTYSLTVVSSESRDWVQRLQVGHASYMYYPGAGAPALFLYTSEKTADEPGAHRIRRVKCDETKPHCLRCISTGRNCEGYIVKPDGRKRSKKLKPPQISRQQRQQQQCQLYQQQSIISVPGVNFSGSRDEWQAFDYFRSCTLQSLSYSLQAQSWAVKFMMQLSHHDEAVRLAAVALGALNRRFQINQLLTLDNESANGHQELARQHYLKALHLLVRQLARNGLGTVENSLSACFLLSVFEFMQGNDEACCMHIRHGLTILFQTLLLPPPTVRQEAIDQNSIKWCLIRLFSILDIQAVMWLSLPTFESALLTRALRIPGGNPLLAADPYPPVGDIKGEIYNTLSELEDAGQRRLGHVALFVRYASNFADPQSPGSFPDCVHTEHENLMRQARQFPGALHDLLARIGPALTTDETYRVALQTIKYRMNILWLSTALASDESMVYQEHTPTFAEIVDMSSTLLYPVNVVVDGNLTETSRWTDESNSPMPIFTFRTGIIRPLFFTAVKCHDAQIRSRALFLLASRPWREGAWDSAAMAKIAVQRCRARGWFHDEIGGEMASAGGHGPLAISSMASTQFG